MKTFLLFCLGVLILALSVLIALVAYLLVDEVRDTIEANKRMRKL